MPNRSFLALAAAAAFMLALPGALAAEEPQVIGADQRRALQITVYSEGIALIDERRVAELPGGAADLVLGDLPQSLLAESFYLRGAGLSVSAQRFSDETLSPATLLKAREGESVLWIREHPTSGEALIEEVELLSVDGPVIRAGGRIEVNPPGRLALQALPPGHGPGRRVHASIEGPAGEQSLDLTYLAEGFNWQAFYLGRIAEDGERMSLAGRAQILNATDLDLPEAPIGLIAGDIKRAKGGQPREPMLARAMAAEAADAAPREAVGDVHLYKLPQSHALPAGTLVQAAFLEAASVPVDRIYRFHTNLQRLWNAGQQRSGDFSPAEVTLRLDNTAEGGLGVPMPAGVLSITEASSVGEVFVGEARIDHTPKGREIELALGTAFDVTGKARLTDRVQLSNRAFEAAHEVTLKNAKPKPVTVEVIADLPGDWEILEESHDHETLTASRLSWPVRVPAGGEAALTYRVRVTY